MRANIRRLHSPDIADLPTWRPDVPDNFGFLLQILAGPADGIGEESFDVTVCTPKWLAEKYGPNGVVSGLHHLIVFDYNYRKLVAHIERAVHSAEGRTWNEIASVLAKFGHWEFEEYRD
ncbi:MAG: immunity 8 family protein [Dongiaceae bacterium]